MSGRVLKSRNLRNLLKDAEKNASNHQSTKVANQSRAGHDDTPAEGKGAEVVRRTLDFLEDDVTGNLKEDIGDEDCLRRVSEMSFQFQGQGSDSGTHR